MGKTRSQSTLVSNNRIVIDSSGNIGIGSTIDPSYPLHVRGDTNPIIAVEDTTNNVQTILRALDSVGYVGTQSNHDLYLIANGTTRATIDSSGRLLVGTSSVSTHRADALVQIETGGNGNCLNLRARSSDDRYAYINLQDNAGSETAASIHLDRSATNAGTLVFSTTADGASSPTERMRIDSSGRLLVGTSNGRNVAEASQANLQVEGTSYNAISVVSNTNDLGSGSIRLGKSRGTTNSSNTIVRSGDYLGTIAFAGADGTDLETTAASISALVDGTPGANDMPGRLVFSTTADGTSSPTERMRIKCNGRVLIGTSTDGGTGGVTIRPNASNGAATIVFDRANTAATSTAFVFENNDSTVGSITHTNTATAFNTSSDYRLKENVVDLDGAIDRVKQLTPKRFNFIADAETTVDGFLAHEAQAVVPEAVIGTHNEVDGDGNPVYQGIDQSKLVPLLTAALQEAIAKIEILEGEVNDLKLQIQ